MYFPDDGRMERSSQPPDISLRNGLQSTDPNSWAERASVGLDMVKDAAASLGTTETLHDCMPAPLSTICRSFNAKVSESARIELASPHKTRLIKNGCATLSTAMMNCEEISEALENMGPHSLEYYIDDVIKLVYDDQELARVVGILQEDDAFKGLLAGTEVWREAVGVADPENISEKEREDGQHFLFGYYVPLLATAKYLDVIPDQSQAIDVSNISGFRPNGEAVLPPLDTFYDLFTRPGQNHTDLGIDMVSSVAAATGNIEPVLEELARRSPALHSARGEALNLPGVYWGAEGDKEFIAKGLDTIAFSVGLANSEVLAKALWSLDRLDSHEVKEDVAAAYEEARLISKALKEGSMDLSVARRKYLKIAETSPLLDSICEAFDISTRAVAHHGFGAGKEDTKLHAFVTGGYTLIIAFSKILERIQLKNQAAAWEEFAASHK